MIEAVLLTVAVMFAALGVCEFINFIKTLFLFPGVKTDNCSVIYLKSGHAINQLRFFSAKLRWYGSEYCDKIIAITDDLGDIEAAACEKYCYGSDIRLCRTDGINSVL